MSTNKFDLDDLEKRVGGRYAEKMAALWTLPDGEFSTVEFGADWTEHLKPVADQGRTIEISTVGQPLPPPIIPLPTPVMQFPREQWITYPQKRTISLLIADRMIDLWDTVAIEQQAQVGYLVLYGGRERIA